MVEVKQRILLWLFLPIHIETNSASCFLIVFTYCAKIAMSCGSRLVIGQLRRQTVKIEIKIQQKCICQSVGAKKVTSQVPL